MHTPLVAANTGPIPTSFLKENEMLTLTIIFWFLSLSLYLLSLSQWVFVIGAFLIVASFPTLFLIVALILVAAYFSNP